MMPESILSVSPQMTRLRWTSEGTAISPPLLGMRYDERARLPDQLLRRRPLVGGHLSVRASPRRSPASLKTRGDDHDLPRPCALNSPHVSQEERGPAREVDADLLHGLPPRGLLEAPVRGADHPPGKSHLAGPRVALPLRPPDEEDLLARLGVRGVSRRRSALFSGQGAAGLSYESLETESRGSSPLSSQHNLQRILKYTFRIRCRDIV